MMTPFFLPKAGAYINTHTPNFNYLSMYPYKGRKTNVCMNEDTFSDSSKLIVEHNRVSVSVTATYPWIFWAIFGEKNIRFVQKYPQKYP